MKRIFAALIAFHFFAGAETASAAEMTTEVIRGVGMRISSTLSGLAYQEELEAMRQATLARVKREARESAITLCEHKEFRNGKVIDRGSPEKSECHWIKYDYGYTGAWSCSASYTLTCSYGPAKPN